MARERTDPKPVPEDEARRIREAVQVTDLTGRLVLRETIGSLSDKDGKVVAEVSGSLAGTSVYVEAKGRRVIAINLQDAINTAAQILNGG